MQHVVAFGVQAVAAQFGEAGDAPQIRGHAPVGFQQLLRSHDFAQDRARTHQLHAVLALAVRLQLVHALDDAFLVALGQTGLRVVFVHHRQPCWMITANSWPNVGA
ncbi:hypothetical protein G6F24_017582 [Rhizopus arrhizus]|nr:hypothetical protein G6F24_017582 [Rhizopus arrhizus]